LFGLGFATAIFVEAKIVPTVLVPGDHEAVGQAPTGGYRSGCGGCSPLTSEARPVFRNPPSLPSR
jgi:hypothetical protein